MKRRLAEFLVLLMVALGAGPVGAAMWQWSTTAGNNATADPSINWSEGMSPSSVNDSARAMMAATAAWRNDISATNTTAGSSTAYTLATSEGVDTTPVNGQMLAFIPHVTNGASPSLTADGGNTYPIWFNGTPVGASTMIAGTPYRMAFSSANSAWLLEGGYGNPYSIPLGGYLYSSMPNPPNSNFTAANGGCISRSAYAAYFAGVSTTYGACDGTTTFGLPDMRGRVPAMLDGGAGRLTNNANGCGITFNSLGVACGNESQTLTILQMPAHYHAAGIADPGHVHSFTALQFVSNTAGITGSSVQQVNLSPVSTSSATTGVRVTSDHGNDTTYSTGGGTAHPIVMPTFGVNVFVRIL